MRLRRATLLGIGVLLALTACTDNSGSGSAAGPTNSSGTTTTGPTGAASAPPNCAVGNWKATVVTAEGDFGSATGTISGGTGATMNVGRDGVTELNFSGSKPVEFTVKLAGATVRGQAQYDGTAYGAVAFGPQDADGKGSWSPQGKITWDTLKGTVKLTEPVSVTLLDNARISDFTGDKATQAGGAVDVQPILRNGTYTCSGDTLRVRTLENGPNMEWTFTKA